MDVERKINELLAIHLQSAVIKHAAVLIYDVFNLRTEEWDEYGFDK